MTNFSYLCIMKEEGYIYTLSSGGIVRYVGQTVKPDKRYKDHLKEAQKQSPKTYNAYKNRWIRKCVRLNKDITLEILDIVPRMELDYWECHYMEQMRQWGFKLTNTAFGGKGGLRKGHHSKETIELLRKKSIEAYKKGLLTGLHPRHGWTDEQRRKSLQTRIKNGNNTPIIQIDKLTGKELNRFNTVIEASKALNIKANKIWKVLKGRDTTEKRVLLSTKGFIFKRV